MSEAEASESAVLSGSEVRVLACLVEKEATTPETYPLTENAVQLACNQKSNREPVLELGVGEVGHALRSLETRGLARGVHGARAQRWEHRFADGYSLTRAQQALLAVLMLRGAQTASELFARGERLAKLSDLDEARHCLERLAAREPALVVNVGRGAGQREDRWMHLLAGPVEVEAVRAAAPASGPARGALDARVEALEAEVARLRELVERVAGQPPDL
ncbi:YceH family protein [Coralloluteibacterium stylophorae]|uniref:DUF480 domain-containing protein n=2 Tax=Coralloluteibacterium stylophorae TaxID=1776034 RepID=A0AAP2FYF2_9GAMM|nr:DUF480 domain-containing protein [Coralloluteibacterium stylophorae]MBS7455611.1 DUF480 domain-containing protein [Coralloluteibacterium stylophorae]